MLPRWLSVGRVLTRATRKHYSGSLLRVFSERPIQFGVSRSFSTPEGSADSASITPNANIYVSESIDPYFNLSLEDWLFRHAPSSQPLLLMYRDSPCVVIGRHQNPWTELNFPALRAAGIPFLRRRSGGGTVYHDLGNTNFSIHLPRASFDRHKTGEIVKRALRSLGIDAQLNDRNDICIGPDKISLLCTLHGQSGVFSAFKASGPAGLKPRSELRPAVNLGRKNLTAGVQTHPISLYCARPCSNFTLLFYVSGSAYKIVNKRAYHHGTMLISTRLDTLGDVLRAPEQNIITKGVASVRSPVCNLRHHSGLVSHESFVAAVVSQFRQEYAITSEVRRVLDTDSVKAIPYIQQSMVELSTREGKFGGTPEFTHSFHRTFPWAKVDVKIRSKHGVIVECQFEVENTSLRNSVQQAIRSFIVSSCVNKRYGFLHEVPAAPDQPPSNIFHLDGAGEGLDDHDEALQAALTILRWIQQMLRY